MIYSIVILQVFLFLQGILYHCHHCTVSGCSPNQEGIVVEDLLKKFGAAKHNFQLREENYLAVSMTFQLEYC